MPRIPEIEWTDEEQAEMALEAMRVIDGTYGRCVRCLEPKPSPGCDDLCGSCKVGMPTLTDFVLTRLAEIEETPGSTSRKSSPGKRSPAAGSI